MAKKLNYKQVWWSVYLTRFNFKLYYCLEKLIGKSNILFQRPNYSTNSNDNSDIVLIKPKFLVVCVMEDIVVEDEEKTLLTDICYENQIDKQEESVVRAVQNLQQSSTRLIHTSE